VIGGNPAPLGESHQADARAFVDQQSIPQWEGSGVRRQPGP
jgi:hypothetical protein